MGMLEQRMMGLTEVLAEDPELAGGCTVPDYPYIGEAVGDGPSVSFVGKANYRWPPPEHPEFCGERVRESKASLLDYLERGASIEEILEESRRVGEEFRTERVAGYYAGRRKSQRSDTRDPGYFSHWWTFVVEVAIGLRTGAETLPRHKNMRKDVDEAIASIHTTNLFKVAHVEANPTGDLVWAQLDNGGTEILQEEFSIADPDVVIFPINTSYPESRERLFSGWEESEKQQLETGWIKTATWQGMDVPVFLTRHPQGASREHLNAVYQRIANDVL